MSETFSKAYNSEIKDTKPDCPIAIRRYKRKTSGFMSKIKEEEDEYEQSLKESNIYERTS
jgi:hypothetical protein